MVGHFVGDTKNTDVVSAAVLTVSWGDHHHRHPEPTSTPSFTITTITGVTTNFVANDR
jgi:hypothetical protein